MTIIAMLAVALSMGALSAAAEDRPPPGAKIASDGQRDVSAEWPPPDRLLQWNPGVQGGIPSVPVTVKLAPKDLPGDGKTSVSAALQRAIDGAKTPGAVLLPAGTFLLDKQVNLKSGVVLRGAGLDKTLLVVRGGGLQARGGKDSREVAITAGAKLGSRQLSLAAAEGFQAGQLVCVCSDNDPELMYTKPDWNVRWGDNSMGQIVRLAKVAGSTVTLDEPLRLEYKASLKPRLRKLTPVNGIGIEDLHVRRDDRTDGAIIAFLQADNCWMRDCETELGMSYHIQISCSRHVTVENCYIHHAHDQGGGGHGYGVEVDTCSSDCLVQNNLFHTLRHAMIIQKGANGCVFAYNYSFDTAGSNDSSKDWFHSNDISIHGHYPYATLYEGNVVQRIGVGDFWGPAGPRVTLFRNRIAAPEKAHDLEHYSKLGIRRMQMAIYVKDHTHGTNVIGNTLTDDASLVVEDTCRNTLVEGNLVKGKVQWNQTKPVGLPASLFLKAKPSYWGNKPWPCIGADVDAGVLNSLPAQDWHARIKQIGHAVPFSSAGAQ